MGDETPPRRWPRYTLRTLFVVVTVVCVWMSWRVNQFRVRERHFRTTTAGYVPARDASVIPISWRLMGARAFDRIIVDQVSSIETNQALHEAFPEADIVIDPMINLHRGWPPYDPQPKAKLQIIARSWSR
jgi:hypothetical protein